ncbi:type II secretion system F family protein [Microvirga sp. ACRRW]|uniref:type II secretion system F family protein n=1 Tax=Microvirga sp. ACRRW TaxID=2918205 RepID=UPI001EF658D9|nr:type II secretion system F family protein [Microvirga sp. ACRRW]MCG7391510.1 type II secretion system F family protein [Microvirga sp. ACRRW]
MLTPELIPVYIALLVTFCAGGVVIALFYSYFERRSESYKRFAAIAASGPSIDREAVSNETRRRKAVEVTLRELEDKQKIKKTSKLTLSARIRQAGLSWTLKTYYLVCVIAGSLTLLMSSILFGLGPFSSVAFGLTGALLVPYLYVNGKRSHRFKNFSMEFPNAVDVIVRGVKAGLPLGDCLRIIAMEAQEPVKSEFRIIIEDQTLGLPMDESVQKLVERIPLPEANFFAIVIALQSRTGGSLSEALSNLSKVLRERKKMKAKIKAVSSEAKASAGIIGSLPVVVATLIYLTSPEYISLLFTTATGNITLAVSGFWMLIGCLVMRKMINFDF